MRLTYKQVSDSEKLVGELLQFKPAPTARLAAQIARNTRQLEGALKDLAVAKNTLLAPYMVDGEYKEELLAPDVKVALYKEYEELLNTEVEVDIHPLKLSDLEAVEQSKPGFEIPTTTFYLIGWMFDFDN